MIFIIVGKPGSGKKYLSEKMTKIGFTITESEDTSDIKNHDAVILDPSLVQTTIEQLSDQTFCIIKINTDDSLRKIYALRSVDKNHKIEAEQKFEEENTRNFEKYQEFDDATEAYRQNFNTFPDNMINIIEFQNDYTEKTAEDCAEYIKSYKTITKKMTGIIKDAVGMNMFKQNDDHPNEIELQSNDKPKFISYEMFAGMLISNNGEFWHFMMNYICKSDRFKDI